MGNRLTKIYTRTGDKGTTGMADGSRASKADTIFALMGDIDELNSQIGMTRSLLAQTSIDHINCQQKLQQELTVIQHLLFNLGGELAMPSFEGIQSTHIIWLEHSIDTMNTHLPVLKDFILPTGSVLVSQIHIARAVCRRAERQAVALYETNPQTIRIMAMSFLNRLSDWLFVTARFCTNTNEQAEVLWNSQVLQNLP